MTRKHKFLGLIVLPLAVLFTGCGEDPKPKPESFLRLDYTLGDYTHFESDCPYTFDYNTFSRIKSKGNCNFIVEYPKMKATIYLTYKPVQNNLDLLLRDAEKLTYEHVIKADEIDTRPFINRESKVYGMFSQVGGDAATNAQFYATDSTRHFLTGSMYFYAKPNFDSIMPAAAYIKEDMQNLMESLRWKN
ncbi:gliding motility lipoprotein GldD [Flavobacterium psychrotrophum]|uniref:gliding motility lipoprotein GldD n=1 Tax=Flavobacterium psychrotrophum TaxID=2294119 RepID=UPI000E31072A|nr:gliding motility lipoprotein GldD [Flavobacterium psychrotrophum]